ncbi:type VII secretion protein EccB [Streptomyces hoynatensis]|uniref:Type VII secretion protein EccB n=1 Tax=Streptomyces hoynatensis TaxID=1141874 RepID=A0A3A9Z4N9_9ACTN|nr:type VII secretion protein EccB [Streptomyces hoynatensis]RKN43029.1 type VII secretion protein EccB [Streptomyces hoynatensis]
MATTRERADAHAYDSRRRSTSLLRGADEAARDPRRRLNRTLAAGTVLAVLLMAGFGIAGWLGGGRGPALPSAGAVVVGEDGDSYVVSDGTVHPALNLSSALLVGGGQLTRVRQATLDAAPRGLPVGIPGAPDALPDEGRLLDGDWTLCVIPAETGGSPTRTALYVSVPGVAPGEGAAGVTLLAQTDDGGLWLLTEGRRHALTEAVRGLLGLQRVRPVPLPPEVLATVPEGPAITAPEPGGAGAEPQVALPFPARVGDLAHTGLQGANPQYYLVRPDGLVSVSPLVYALLGATAGADHALDGTQAAAAPRSAEPPPGDAAWPDALPRAAEPGREQPVCVSTPPGSEPGDAPWRATVHLPGRMPEPAGLAPVTSANGARLGLLDAVYLPPGAGALVLATTSGGTGGTHTLITDAGIAYPFASAEAVQRLRYDHRAAPSMPRAFVDLLPRGPVLDPEDAARELRERTAEGDGGEAGAADGAGAAGEAGQDTEETAP